MTPPGAGLLSGFPPTFPVNPLVVFQEFICRINYGETAPDTGARDTDSFHEGMGTGWKTGSREWLGLAAAIKGKERKQRTAGHKEQEGSRFRGGGLTKRRAHQAGVAGSPHDVRDKVGWTRAS